MARRFRRDDLDGDPRSPKRRKVADPLASSIQASVSEAHGTFTAINHDMQKAMMALKRGDFAMAIQCAGSAATTSQNLSRTLVHFEDLVGRMKQREEFKAEQIRLIEAGEYPAGHGSTSKVV